MYFFEDAKVIDHFHPSSRKTNWITCGNGCVRTVAFLVMGLLLPFRWVRAKRRWMLTESWNDCCLSLGASSWYMYLYLCVSTCAYVNNFPQKDSNWSPPHYVLQDLNLLDAEMKDTWWKSYGPFRVMQEMLRSAANALNISNSHMFAISVTEEEIHNGMFNNATREE